MFSHIQSQNLKVYVIFLSKSKNKKWAEYFCTHFYIFLSFSWRTFGIIITQPFRSNLWEHFLYIYILTLCLFERQKIITPTKRNWIGLLLSKVTRVLGRLLSLFQLHQKAQEKQITHSSLYWCSSDFAPARDFFKVISKTPITSMVPHTGADLLHEAYFKFTCLIRSKISLMINQFLWGVSIMTDD